MGVVHTKALHWQKVVGQISLCARRLFAVNVTKTPAGERNCCCVRLCVHVIVLVPARKFFLCVSVLQDTILDVLVLDESAGV